MARSIRLCLISEGYSYEDVKGDPGGPTKYGITIHDVRRYLKKGATAADVRALTLEQAITIYEKHYWEPIGGDELWAGVDYSGFDYAVNAGQGRAGPAVERAVEAAPYDPVRQVKLINDARMKFQMGLPSRFNKFKRGWRNRINSVQRIGTAMAQGTYKAGAGGLLIPARSFGKAYLEVPEDVR